jgi:hypothetical protein
MVRRLTGVVLFVLLVAACGGSSDKTIAKADLIKQGNVICQKASASIDKEFQKLPADATEAQQIAFIKDTAVPQTKQQIKDLRALGYPKGDKATLEKIYADSDKLLADIAADPKKNYIDATGDPFAGINTKLDAYGLTACGSG